MEGQSSTKKVRFQLEPASQSEAEITENDETPKKGNNKVEKKDKSVSRRKSSCTPECKQKFLRLHDKYHKTLKVFKVKITKGIVCLLYRIQSLPTALDWNEICILSMYVCIYQ